MNWAEEILESEPVFLDTETTGLGNFDQVVEVAVVEANGDELLNTLVEPTIPIPVDATLVHGITDANVCGMPDIVAVVSDLAYILDDRVIVIYNADYDLRLLDQSLRAYGLRWDLLCKPRAVLCAMKAYARFWGEWNEYYQSYRWQRLEDAARQQGIAIPSDLHRAKADAELTRRLLIKMAGEDQRGR